MRGLTYPSFNYFISQEGSFMGLLSFFKKLLGGGQSAENAAREEARKAAGTPLGGAAVSSTEKKTNEFKEFTFEKIPESKEEFLAIPEAGLKTPYESAAMVVLALCTYKQSPDLCCELLEYVNGPYEVSNFEKQSLRDRLGGKEYKPFSFFEGATPQNDYTPDQPYKIRVESNPYSFDNEGYATLYVRSGGADTARQITLRRKGQEAWYLNQQLLLADIRIPKSEDPWA